MTPSEYDYIDSIAVGSNEDEPDIYAVLRSEATMDQAVEAVSREAGVPRDCLSVRAAKERWTWGDPADYRGRLRLVWHVEVHERRNLLGSSDAALTEKPQETSR